MAKQSRDNEYFKQRLKKERPELYRQVMAGAITVNKARQLAGLGGKRTRLSELKNAWKKASAAEQAEFIRWAGLAPHRSSSATASPGPVGPVFDIHGAMALWARKRVLEILVRRSLTSGDLASELGLSRLDVSVMAAAKNGTRIRKFAVTAAVEAWLAKNAAV